MKKNLSKQRSRSIFNFSFSLLAILFFSINASYAATLNSSTETLQELTITGKVLSEDGSPLPGANIVIQGSFKGVISKADGTYEISVPSEESILVFSFIGYANQTITVGKLRVINVTLLPDTETIEELVVVGYAVEQKVLLTGSVELLNRNLLRIFQ